MNLELLFARVKERADEMTRDVIKGLFSDLCQQEISVIKREVNQDGRPIRNDPLAHALRQHVQNCRRLHRIKRGSWPAPTHALYVREARAAVEMSRVEARRLMHDSDPFAPPEKLEATAEAPTITVHLKFADELMQVPAVEGLTTVDELRTQYGHQLGMRAALTHTARFTPVRGHVSPALGHMTMRDGDVITFEEEPMVGIRVTVRYGLKHVSLNLIKGMSLPSIIKKALELLTGTTHQSYKAFKDNVSLEEFLEDCPETVDPLTTEVHLPRVELSMDYEVQDQDVITLEDSYPPRSYRPD